VNRRLSSSLKLRHWMKSVGIEYSIYRGDRFIAIILKNDFDEDFQIASMIINHMREYEPDSIYVCRHYWRFFPEPYAVLARYDPDKKYDLWDFEEKGKIRKWDYLDTSTNLMWGMKLLSPTSDLSAIFI